MHRFWHFKGRTPPGWLVAVLALVLAGVHVTADDFIIAPTFAGNTATGTIFPFLINETDITSAPPVPTMRYQQVYNASLFTNANPGLIYVTTLAFYPYSNLPAWNIPSMQINLSTTSKTATNLSLVFSENVGADDTVVHDRGPYSFPANPDPSIDIVLFNRPFRYNSPLGNLLLDVRIYDGSGYAFPPTNPRPRMAAFNSSTDEVARVWSTNVMATTASGSDTVGLYTEIELSPIPSLQAQFFPVYETTLSNIIVISWPSEPTNFVLQSTRHIGTNAAWGPLTNFIHGLNGQNQGGGRWIEVPAASAAATAFYRLVWPSGTAASMRSEEHTSELQ